jgi:5'-nucleotidase (lipoprotein e(P4) family)
MKPSGAALALLLACSSCAFSQRTWDGLSAVLWQQTSQEYRGLALQAYATGRLTLDRALKDKNWTAALEQKGKFRNLPPAVILDLDETILDNSPHQARAVIEANGRFDPARWHEWTSQRKATAIPGAVEFVRYARSRKVTVFYVTNRDFQEEGDTKANLAGLGLEVEDLTQRKGFAEAGLGDTLLTLNQQKGWGSDKTSRRELIARFYRVLLLFGDDLNDFLSGVRSSPAERARLAEPLEAMWGTKWIILPNASYGSWEGALLDFNNKLTDAEVLEKETGLLRKE